MDSNTIFCALCWTILVAGTNLSGVHAQKSQCSKAEFWNADMEHCVACSICKEYPKTPFCDTCLPMEGPPSDPWRLAAITSLAVLAAVLVSGVLVIGVLVHRCRSRRRTLREPIEETTGPLHPV